MSDLNKVLLIGRLGIKPEAKKTQGGESLARLRVATSYESSKGDGQFERETEWHNVVVFGRLADQCAEHLDKGRLVYVEGKLCSHTWTDKEGVERTEREVRAHHVHFLSSRPGETGRSEQNSGQVQNGGRAQSAGRKTEPKHDNGARAAAAPF